MISTHCLKSEEWRILLCWDGWKGLGGRGRTCNGTEDEDDLGIEGDKQRERDKENSSNRLRALDWGILEEWRYEGTGARMQGPQAGLRE